MHPADVAAVATSLLALAVAWTTGAFVYFARPQRLQNRLLAVWLGIEGGYIGGVAFVRLAPDAFAARGASGLHDVLGTAGLAVYLLFLSTLATPLVAPFRTRIGRIVVAAMGATLGAAWLASPGGWSTVIGPAPVGGWVVQDDGAGTIALLAALVLFLFGFAASFTAWRRAAPGSAEKVRAKAFAIAYGVRDLLFAVGILVSLPLYAGGDPVLVSLHAASLGLIEIVYVLLLVYGIAKTSLFDIDLKIKWTLRRGTVAAAFVAVFVVVSQVAQNVLSDALGLVVGGVATGLLLLALGPLQRAADRVAEAAVPRATGSPEYVAFRKLEVYKAAVESAHETGGIDERERASLDRMREKLRIRREDAVAVESDVTSHAHDRAAAG